MQAPVPNHFEWQKALKRWPVLAALAFSILAGDTRAEQSVEAWVRSYGPGVARALAVDGSGNVFVTGLSPTGPNGFPPYDYVTVAYSSSGTALWTNRYHGPGNDNQARAVAVDSSGHVFVTGSSLRSADCCSYDYATIAYSSAGVALWTNRYPGEAYAIAADGSGHVFVTGYADLGPGIGADYATIAYSSAGTALWTNLYNGPGNDNDEAVAVAVDASGNIYVTGYSYSDVGVNRDYATLAYSGAGVPLWTNRYNGPGHDYDNALAVAVGSNGNVYVTGTSTRALVFPYATNDWATIAYSSAGVPLWTNRFYEGFDNTDSVWAVAAGGDKVFVTGSWRRSGGTSAESTYDYATLAYSSAGVALWTNYYNGLGNGNDFARSVAVDAIGNVFVTGFSARTNIFPYTYDFATIKYSNAGIPLWTNRHNGTPQGKFCLAVGPDGSAYVAGTDRGDFLTVKYVSVPPLTSTLTRTNTVVISWPFPSAGFELQQNTDLSTANWISPPETISSNANAKLIIANPPRGNRFFRLVHP